MSDVLEQIDVKGFTAELDELRRETFASLSEDDFRHLRRVELYGRFSAVLGYSSAWIFPNPLSAFCLSLAQFTRWLLAHHITHRGYDKVPGTPPRYTSVYFAKGLRRFIDWFDWIHPKAWDHEHNYLHHYHTGEDDDPDVAERHTEFIRALRIPRFFKYVLILLASLTWKYTYYAPNTMSVLDPESKKRLKREHIVFITIKNIFQLSNKHVRALWTSCYLPYVAFNFVFIPLLFFPLGEKAVIFVLLNKLLAECMTNFHSFLVIGPNHTAEDLYRFRFHYRNKGEFYVTSVLGSVNYRCGTEFLDYMSIWLNYQIEHHIFPDLPMSKYREIQPKVKALCAKYSIPYRQEGIWKRFGRMLDVCVGKTSMPQLVEFPGTWSDVVFVHDSTR